VPLHRWLDPPARSRGADAPSRPAEVGDLAGEDCDSYMATLPRGLRRALGGVDSSSGGSRILVDPPAGGAGQTGLGNRRGEGPGEASERSASAFTSGGPGRSCSRSRRLGAPVAAFRWSPGLAAGNVLDPEEPQELEGSGRVEVKAGGPQHGDLGVRRPGRRPDRARPSCGEFVDDRGGARRRPSRFVAAGGSFGLPVTSGVIEADGLSGGPRATAGLVSGYSAGGVRFRDGVTRRPADTRQQKRAPAEAQAVRRARPRHSAQGRRRS